LVVVVRATQAPPQGLYPPLHVKVHAPLTHAGCPSATPGQALPQPLQLSTSVCSSTQVLPQRLYPLLHAKVHALPMHAGSPLATPGQGFPQPLQLSTSVCSSTQVLPQSVGVVDGHPDEHA
jgi:hypothetical protein